MKMPKISIKDFVANFSITLLVLLILTLYVDSSDSIVLTKSYLLSLIIYKAIVSLIIALFITLQMRYFKSKK